MMKKQEIEWKMHNLKCLGIINKKSLKNKTLKNENSK